MDFVDNNIQKVQVQPEDQVYARNEDIKVYGKLVSMSTENVVADSKQIWDKGLKKNQSDINSVTQSKFGQYLPLAGGRIDGDLGVTGRVDLGGPLEIGLGINARTITVDDGSNSANFTPTSIELGLGKSDVKTHISAQEIITDKISVTDVLPLTRYDMSITPDRIQMSKGNDILEYTVIRPSGILTNGSIRLKNGTDQDVLLGNGSTTDRLIKDVTAAAIQSEYNFNFITTGNVNNFVTIKAATSTTAGVMTAADKAKLDDIENTYLSLSGGTLTSTLRLNDINSDGNGLDINNVNGIQSVDQDKVLTPEVWATNGNSIPLNIANGIAKLDQNGNIPLENLGNLDTQIALVVNQLPTTDIKTNKIYLVRKNEPGQDNAYVEYVYINNSWEKLGEYTPSIDLSEYSLKRQTVSSAAFVNSNNNMSLQLTNADNSKNTIQVPLAQPPIVSAGHLTSGQNGFMSVSDKVKLDSIQADFSNCVKTDKNSTINADVTVNGKISSTDANIVIDSGKLELHEESNGINFIGGDDSSYISASGGKSNEYFAADGSIQTIPDFNTIYKYAQITRVIMVGGFSIEGNTVTGVADIPEGIYYNPSTYTFVAKSNNKYYTSWKKNPSENIADEAHYGIPSDNGVKPYVGQSYAFGDTVKVASMVDSNNNVILEDIGLPTALQ